MESNIAAKQLTTWQYESAFVIKLPRIWIPNHAQFTTKQSTFCRSDAKQLITQAYIGLRD